MEIPDRKSFEVKVEQMITSNLDMKSQPLMMLIVNAIEKSTKLPIEVHFDKKDIIASDSVYFKLDGQLGAIVTHVFSKLEQKGWNARFVDDEANYRACGPHDYFSGPRYRVVIQ